MARQGFHEILIIGAGIGGVIALKYARDAGVDALVVEQQTQIGGLWAKLPSWQDIQYNRIDWTLGDLPIHGEDQASIRANIESWVDRFGLAEKIWLNCPARQVRHDGTHWIASTPKGDVVARYLIAATGIHNRAIIPRVERRSSTVRECHSSALWNPEDLRGRRVVVVGGGASAFDLLDLCFEHDASHIVWVYRGVGWMSPSHKPKHDFGGPRELGRLQMQGLSTAALNDIANNTLRRRYEKLGLMDVMPSKPFDFGHNQMIPGRYRMIDGFARIDRHQGEVECIVDGSVRLSDGRVVQTDLLLWGTGYEADTRYFESPLLSRTWGRAELDHRLGSMFLSLDGPNLFFLAPALLETTGTTPLAYSYVCRSIMAHVQGKARFDERPIEGHRNHLALLDVLADIDPYHFPEGQWRTELNQLVCGIPDTQAMPIP